MSSQPVACLSRKRSLFESLQYASAQRFVRALAYMAAVAGGEPLFEVVVRLPAGR
jgi:hypothetical protein